MEEENKDLISLDVSRCDDFKCPIRGVCERFLQYKIDFKKKRKNILTTDFKGREAKGLCKHFLNVDVKET